MSTGQCQWGMTKQGHYRDSQCNQGLKINCYPQVGNDLDWNSAAFLRQMGLGWDFISILSGKPLQNMNIWGKGITEFSKFHYFFQLIQHIKKMWENETLVCIFFFGCRVLECFSSLWWYHIDACKLILYTIWKLWLSWSMVVLNCTERFALSFGQHIKCKTLLGLTIQAWELGFCNRITSRNNVTIHSTNNMIYDTSYLKKISTLQVWKIILTPIPKEE